MKAEDQAYYKPENICPVCGYVLDSATSPENKKFVPAEGDVSICIRCTTILVFNKDLLSVLPDEETLHDLQSNHKQWTYLQRIRNAIKEQNHEYHHLQTTD